MGDVAPQNPPRRPRAAGAVERHPVRPGARLGIDVGSVRVGVAVSDPDGLLASPVETVRRAVGVGPVVGRARRPDLERIAVLAQEVGVVEVVVGLPLSMSGARGVAAETALAYARELAGLLAPVPVRAVDERLSTVSAHGQLHGAGVGSRARREVVDQAAAVIILQSALDAERSSGRAPGEVVAVP